MLIMSKFPDNDFVAVVDFAPVCHNPSVSTSRRLCGTFSSSMNKSADQNPQIADNFNTRFNLPSRSWKNIFRKRER